MSPTKEISPQESEKLSKWIIGEKHQGFLVGKTGEDELMSVALIGGDPIVIFYNKIQDKRRLSCGKNLSLELEKKGIVEFPKPLPDFE